MRFFCHTPPRGRETEAAPHGASHGVSHGVPHPDRTEGLAALAKVLAEFGPDRLLAGPAEPPAERGLRDAARQLCDEARARDPRAEQLLIALKRSWPELPAVRAVPAYTVRDALWQRLVAVCVEEFYSPRKQH